MLDPASYSELCREERQFAALFAHLLMSRSENVEALLDFLNERLPDTAEPFDLHRAAEAQIFVEFAYLRD